MTELSNAVDAEVYLSSGQSSHPADINLVLEQLPIATPEAAARFGAPPKEGFTIAPALVQPTSRGQVRLASADWRALPIIEANHLGTDHDLTQLGGDCAVDRHAVLRQQTDLFARGRIALHDERGGVVHPRAEQLIAELRLEVHPEGGFYRELFRSRVAVLPADDRGPRAFV